MTNNVLELHVFRCEKYVNYVFHDKHFFLKKKIHEIDRREIERGYTIIKSRFKFMRKCPYHYYTHIKYL